MEKYNKYHESLDIDCGCGKDLPKPKKSSNCCGGINLPSHDNELEVLVRQLYKEVQELMKTTTAKLLCQDKKIAETMVYIKNNLSNALRLLLNSMLESGQLEDLITGVVANSIEVLQNDVEALQLDMNNVKAQQTVNTNDILNLKGNKLEFESYSEDNIFSKFLNAEFSCEYINNSIVYITKIKNIDKLSVLPTNGVPSGDVYLNRTDIMNYAKTHDDYDLYINGGMSGIYIFDGVVNQTSRLDCPYYLGFTSDNEMKFYNGLASGFSLDTLLNDNIVNCLSGFSPLVVNHEAFDFTDITDLASSNQIAQNFADSLPVKHPRQLIGQDDDNNFYIFSIMGRFNNSEGFNYSEMQNYCLSKGLKNAFNLDGGGSMQTIFNKNYIFYPSQELDTNIDRVVPSAIGFKLKGVE